MLEQQNGRERLTALNDWISDCVIDGKRAHYDRTNVLSSNHTEIELSENGATVTIPHINELRRQFEMQDNDVAVGGTCRELAQWTVTNLLKEGVVDNAKVYACATDKEAHYVVIAELDGQQYLVDIAYSQPVLEAIPVDGLDYVSKMYSGKKGTKQAFSGDVTYNAEQKEDGKILFTIDSPSRSTEFPLYPLTEALDAQIPSKWAAATGSGYATRVGQNEDGTYRVDSESMGDAATLQREFIELHEMARQFGTAAIEVVFRDE